MMKIVIALALALATAPAALAANPGSSLLSQLSEKFMAILTSASSQAAPGASIENHAAMLTSDLTKSMGRSDITAPLGGHEGKYNANGDLRPFHADRARKQLEGMRHRNQPGSGSGSGSGLGLGSGSGSGFDDCSRPGDCDVVQSGIVCGQSISGTTVQDDSVNIHGTPANDHAYPFTVDAATSNFTFDTCGERNFDTTLRIVQFVDGVSGGLQGGGVRSLAYNDDACRFGSRVSIRNLEPGANYGIIVTGSGNSNGRYVLTMQCASQSTMSPTPAPTMSPTPAPTLPPSPPAQAPTALCNDVVDLERATCQLENRERDIRWIRKDSKCQDAGAITLNSNGLQDCAAHALAINDHGMIRTDLDRLAMKFSFRNGTNDCIVHGTGECGNMSDTSVVGWGYFGVYDGAAREVWTRNSAGENVLFNNVEGLRDNAAFREICTAGEIRGLWDRHGAEEWRTDQMLLCTQMRSNELCVTFTDDSLHECLMVGTIPANLGGGQDGRVYLQSQAVSGITMDEFLEGTTDDDRDVATDPVWQERLPDIAAVMEDQSVRDLPPAAKRLIFNKIPAVKEAREATKDIVNTRKAVTTVVHPKVCVGGSEFCTVISAP